jgi:hypothetical protein
MARILCLRNILSDPKIGTPSVQQDPDILTSKGDITNIQNVVSVGDWYSSVASGGRPGNVGTSIQS